MFAFRIYLSSTFINKYILNAYVYLEINFVSKTIEIVLPFPLETRILVKLYLMF